NPSKSRYYYLLSSRQLSNTLSSISPKIPIISPWSHPSKLHCASTPGKGKMSSTTRGFKNVGDPDSLVEVLVTKLEEVARLNKDPEVAEKLKGCIDFVEGLENFLNDSASEAAPVQRKILTDTYKEPWTEYYEAGKTAVNLRPSWATGYHEGQFLRIASQITKAKRILEIGTFTGHSAVALALSAYCEELVC
ncbi:unnamed protein product, partial [Allacma fusca]